MMDRLDGKLVGRLKSKVASNTEALLGEPLDVLFFDCTTLYFESVAEDEAGADKDALKAFGYSKDGKAQRVQVVLALAVTREGLPVGYEVFPGAHLRRARVPADDRGPAAPAHGRGGDLRGRRGDVRPRESLGIGGGRASVHRRGAVAQPAQDAEGADREREALPPDRRRGSRRESRRVSPPGPPDRGLVQPQAGEKGRPRPPARGTQAIEAPEPQRPTEVPGAEGRGAVRAHEGQGALGDRSGPDRRGGRWDGLHGVATNVRGMSIEELFERYRGLWQVEQSFRITKHDLKVRPSITGLRDASARTWPSPTWPSPA